MVTPGLARRFRRRLAGLLRPSPARALVAQANAARDAGAWAEAAALYDAALRLAPGLAHVHVQAGHMHKEAGDFSAAARAYAEARRMLPDDADLALQLGHFWKTADRPNAAVAEYARAVALAPSWAEPARELAALEAALTLPEVAVAPAPAWEMLPGPPPPPFPPAGEIDRIELRRLGSGRERLPEGEFPLLAGVEAIRGVCFTDRLLAEAVLLLGGTPLHREPIESRPASPPGVWKAAFNLWVDLSDVVPGVHRLEIVLADAEGWTRRRIERVVIRAPGEAHGLSDSDALVPPVPVGEDVAATVRARPSIVRPAGAARPASPQSILVLRVDQLGDFVVSVPALRRLRALFPAARIVGLLGEGNVDLARTLGLFDEVLVADAPDDFARRRRTMTAEAQAALAAWLAPYRFDVAIDLATSDVSRPLLKLSGAKAMFGFDDAGSPWLDGGTSGRVRDAGSEAEAAPQAGRVLALVERLGTIYAPPPPVVRREELDPALLARISIAPGERYAVLHAGARIAWSRWTSFPALARALLERPGLRVVVLADGADLGELPADSRLTVIDRRLPFDELDALLSFAVVFVGNDSGPKHLASLRGTPVVSIHSARIGWAEWGQEQTGAVISRRVPCAGCAIFHDADECGKGIACVADITVAEVLAAVERELAPADNRLFRERSPARRTDTSP